MHSKYYAYCAFYIPYFKNGTCSTVVCYLRHGPSVVLCPADLRRSWVNVLWICPSLPVVPSHLPTQAASQPTNQPTYLPRLTLSASLDAKRLPDALELALR